MTSPSAPDGKAYTPMLEALAKSTFRAKFHLRRIEREYFLSRGELAIRDHARRFITERLAPADPVNDTRQTPLRNHPVFIAQHATATCCRKCVEKWHHIPRGRPLDDDEVEWMVGLIMAWITRDMTSSNEEDR